jgi:hypothetical protein
MTEDSKQTNQKAHFWLDESYVTASKPLTDQPYLKAHVVIIIIIIINHHHQYYNGRCGREKRRRILFQPVASEVR